MHDTRHTRHIRDTRDDHHGHGHRPHRPHPRADGTRPGPTGASALAPLDRVVRALGALVLLGIPFTELFAFADADGTAYLLDVAEGVRLARERGRLLPFSPEACGVTAADLRSRYPTLDEAHARSLPPEALARPLLFATWQGHPLCVDGHHRLLRAVLDGTATLPAYLLTAQDTERIVLCRRRPSGQASHTPQTTRTMTARFALGKVAITPGAAAALADNRDDPLAFLERHGRCDWGRMCAEDRAMNDAALRTGGRLLSAYALTDGTVLWIITEADRSTSTVLLPDEY